MMGSYTIHKVVREDDKLFHALVVYLTPSKYVLHQAHDTLGTARTYQCLKTIILLVLLERMA